MSQPRWVIVPDHTTTSPVGDSPYTKYTLWLRSSDLPATPNALRREMASLSRQINTLLELHTIAIEEQGLPESAAIHAGILSVLSARYAAAAAELAAAPTWLATVRALEANDGR